MKMNKKIITIIFSFALQGCSTYKANFACPECKGYNCMPLSVVDQKIDNGQIEELDYDYNKKTRGSKILPKVKHEEMNINDLDFDQGISEEEDDE